MIFILTCTISVKNVDCIGRHITLTNGHTEHLLRCPLSAKVVLSIACFTFQYWGFRPFFFFLYPYFQGIFMKLNCNRLWRNLTANKCTRARIPAILQFPPPFVDEKKSSSPTYPTSETYKQFYITLLYFN